MRQGFAPSRSTGICAFVCAMMLSFAATSAGQQPGRPLFEPSQPPQTANAAAAADNALERRFVRVNVAALGSGEPRAASADRPETVTLDLLDRGPLTAVMDHVERLQSGRSAWVGNIEGEEYSAVIFVVDAEAGIVTGTVSSPRGTYRLAPAGDGVHVLSKLDPAGDRGDIVLEAPPVEMNVADPQLSDDGSRIDVMIVYTPAARNAAGGTAAIESLIDLSITETNQSYANSGVTPRLRLVRKQEVSYTESGDFQTDLTRLRNTSDGYVDNVHALRDQYGADMVAMVVEGSQYCGIAYVIGGPSTAHAPNAFQVTARTCATGYYSMGHEFGHIQGARHDWYVDPTSGSPYTYNHGYYPPSRAWRTIMAYADGCFGCTRIQWWSNPNITRNGEAMGIAEGQSQAADNRKTLNNTAFYVANFRAEAGAKAAMVAPAPGSTLAGTTVTFNWGTGTNVSQYWLEVGTGSAGATNIYSASTGTNQSAIVSGLPNNGVPVYVRLWSLISGGWEYNDYTYTATSVACSATSMTNPAPGSTLASAAVIFNWSGNPCATQYWLYVGTGSPGSSNIFGASTGAGTSAAVSGLPTNGATVYVRLWTLATSWTYVDYTYTSFTLACTTTVMTSPVSGSTLTGTSATFTWVGNVCASQFWLSVGTGAPGATNIFDGSTGTSTSKVVTGLPASGETVYVRLWTLAGSWSYIDSTYTAMTAPAAQLVTPVNGSPLVGTSVTFAWNNAAGVSEYWLSVGTTQGAGNVFDGSTGTATSRTVPNMPTSTCSSSPVMTSPVVGSKLAAASQTFNWTDPCAGPKVWARLWSRNTAGWKYFDYSFETKSYKLTLGSIGSAPFGNDIFNGDPGVGTSATANALPADGSTISGCLWRLSGGYWACDGVGFSAAGAATGFNQQFNTPGFLRGWDPVAGTWSTDANGHYVTFGLSGLGASAAFGTQYTTLDFTVVMMRDSAANGLANRIWIRGTPNPLGSTNWWQNAYAFQYTSGGAFSVFKNINGVSVPIQNWTGSAAIIQGANFNTLRVTASGGNLTFSINGTTVWTGTDPSLTVGQVGFGMFDTDWLRVDSATLATTVDSMPTLSDEQRRINETARDEGGTIDRAPRRQ